MRTCVLVWCLALVGCGTPGRNSGNNGGGGGNGGSGGGSGTVVETLVVTPADAVLEVDSAGGVTQAYEVHDKGGGDVTAKAKLYVDDGTMGSFNGATFTASGLAGGVTTVHAVVGDEVGSTKLTVRIKKIVIAPGAPADAPSHFGGAAGGAAPVMVYPPDGALIPPNLNELEVQFTPPAGATLFEVSFVGPALDLKIYTPCVTVGAGCGLLPDEATWKLLSHASASTTVDVGLRSSSPSGVGAAAARKLSFGDEDLSGGLYYWAAASGSINRYDFGKRGQTAEKWYTAQQSGSTCVGCHVLSRNGQRIAVGMNIPGPAQLRTLDVATRATLFDSGAGGGGFPGMGGGSGSNFEALSPDGSRALVNSGANLGMIDTANGMSLGGSLMNATMPDWSADGNLVVFVRSGAGCPLGLCGSQPGVSMGTLLVAPVNGNAFGAETTILTGGGNNYYPSFAPDGKWVAFNRAAADSYDAVDAKVMVVAAAGGSAIDLTAVNASAGNSWPKFAPFVQKFQGEPVFWLTFSSRRDYGLRLQQSTTARDMQIAQLWMVAVSPKRLAAGDGGYPAFWLPFQDLKTGNHIAQWTEKVERAPCSATDTSNCRPDEMCVGNECVGTPIM
jgi:hypothetical protein